MKTIKKEIANAKIKMNYWKNVSDSPTELSKLKITQHRALCEFKFFKGVYHDLLNTNNKK